MFAFICFCCLSAFVMSEAAAQQVYVLNIDTCFAMAKRNVPLSKQYGWIDKSEEYTVENINKGLLPRVNLIGQATYQSDVTQITIPLPNIETPTLPKGQYKIYGEVQQPITDLITIKEQRKWVAANAAVETQKVEVEMYKLRERVNQLYFGILLIDEQMKQLALLANDIQSGIDKTDVSIKNGTAIKSSLENLQAELIATNQRVIELQSNRQAFVDMLAYLIGLPIAKNTKFEIPITRVSSAAINRPELKLFELQKTTFDLQNDLVEAKKLPRFSVFVQGGIGRPALNILKEEAQGYYIAGLRFNWDLSSFYTNNREKQINALNQKQIETQREMFLFNTNLSLSQQNAEIAKIQALMKTDNQIIALRESVKRTTKIQLENGTATANDYLIAVNAEDKARQNLIVHQMQLLMAQYNYLNTTGN